MMNSTIPIHLVSNHYLANLETFQYIKNQTYLYQIKG